jgi:SAM-dependent methyltransferase
VTDIEINSKAYWDRRFLEDWDSNFGREQSRFFATLAVKAMPNWLIGAARTNGWSVCDWGCAEGDGTQVLADTFPDNLMTGIDFSQSAIAVARERYGSAYFAEDWLATEASYKSDAPVSTWDMVFSSNTLEHFANPDMVLRNLCDHATKCVVLLVPYKEVERHPEHAVTFTAGNICFVPHPDFALCYGAVIDASLEEPSYWGGEQVLLIYCRLEQAAALGLSAQDLMLCLGEPPEEEGSQTSMSGRSALMVAQLRKQVLQLREQSQHRQDLAEEMTQEVHRQYARNLELAEEVRRQDAIAQRCVKQYVELERELTAIRRNPLRLLMRRRRGSE